MSALHLIATTKADFRKRTCLLYPLKQTCAVQAAMSTKGGTTSGHSAASTMPTAQLFAGVLRMQVSRNVCSQAHHIKKRCYRALLLLACDVRREIGRFRTREIHIRHPRVRREQKVRNRALVKVRRACDGRERRRLSCALRLHGRDDMATRAPSLGERFSFVCISREHVCRRSQSKK